MITAVYKEVVENEKIVMKWRMKDWTHVECANQNELDPADAGNCFSEVEISFAEGEDSEGCEISIKQADIPEKDKYN